MEVPTPLARDRIADYLTHRGYTFRFDDDGDITGIWDGNRFWFMLLGREQDIVQIRGRWHRPLPDSARRAVLQVINDWNRERIWPKTYLRSESNGLALYTEMSVAFGAGATKSQFDQVLACGLGTAVQFFSSIADLLPPEAQDGFSDDEDDSPEP
jgi:Putative bacterial sensory transduction regulator